MTLGCESTHGNPFRYCSCGWMEDTKPDSDQFLKKAKQVIVDTETFTADDLFIVWFCKVLGNLKALVSTDAVDGAYWEVTYNGAKKETYVDRYRKVSNVAVSDD